MNEVENKIWLQVFKVSDTQDGASHESFENLVKYVDSLALSHKNPFSKFEIKVMVSVLEQSHNSPPLWKANTLGPNTTI